MPHPMNTARDVLKGRAIGMEKPGKPPALLLERVTGIEPAASSLGSSRSAN